MSATKIAPQKSRVTHIAVKRVHNLGNYENIQYEVGVEIGENDDPAKILTSLENILEDVQFKSPVSSYQLERAKKALALPAKERRKQYKQEEMLGFRELIKQDEEAKKRREKAKSALVSLNYTSVYKDAKQDWEEDFDE